MNHIYSMTGYATETVQYDQGEITCEFRSLNSRYLEMFIKLSPAFREMEDKIKELIKEHISRGKVNCSITIGSQESLLQNLAVNEGAIAMYKNILEKIRQVAGIDEAVNLAHILEFKDILSLDEDTHIDERLQGSILTAVKKTLFQLNETRAREGENLVKDVIQRLDHIAKLSKEIFSLGKNNAKVEFEKLYKRLLSLIDEQKVDQNRLEMELAIISDRVDISEEIIRMQSHIDLFRENLNQGSPVGKKLNFILQEMHREANTIASKNTIIEISHRVVAIKEDVERIREQVQNIE